MAGERESTVTVRMSVEERAMLQSLADVDGISVSDVLRMLVRRSHAARRGELQAKPRAKGSR